MLNENKDKIANRLLYLLLAAGVALQIYFIYFGYIYYHYLVPPGSDVIQHYNIIKNIINTGKVDFFVYPPGFHVIVLAISKIFNKDVFSILTYWTPAMVVLPALSLYFLLKQLFDNKVSVITTLIFLLTSGYPLYNFVDGNYPDILAYGVFAILMFAFIFRYLRTKLWYNLIIASLFLLAIAVTHHLTFVSVLSILAIFGLIQLYILITEKKLGGKIWSWKTLSVLVALIILGLSVFIALKFYGPTIAKYADGLFSNKPALNNQYLNKAVDYPDYILFTGDTVWYLGLFGLLFVVTTTFKARKEIAAKQLVIVWVLFFFLMSRLSGSALPARFARELAPALAVCIAFLLNYIFNLNGMRTHNYKAILGFGIIGFMIVTNSALFSGLARLPDSFTNMVWFLPKDQDKLDYLTAKTQLGILYNPYANLYMPIKVPDNFVPIKLTKDQVTLTETAKIAHYTYTPVSAKKAKNLTGYPKMINDLSLEYKNVKFIFIDVKPPTNPDEKTYPRYAGFNVYNSVLDDLASTGQVIKEFDDGSRLIKMF